MAYGLLLIGPVGVTLFAAVAIYKVLQARREEALLGADAAWTQQPVPRPPLFPPRDRGYFPGTPPRILYGDVGGVGVHRSLEEVAVSRPLEAADTLPGSEQVGVADGEEPGQVLETVGEIDEGKPTDQVERSPTEGKEAGVAEKGKPMEVRGSDEEKPPQSSMVAVGWHRACSYVREFTSKAFRVLKGAVEVRRSDEEKPPQSSAVAVGWHRACSYVRESTSKAFEWRPNPRVRRVSVEIADTCVRYYFRGSHVLLRACCATLKREMDWQQQQQQQAPASASKCGKEVKELHTKMDHVRTQIDELRLQNKELLDQIGRLSASKIAKWTRDAWDLAGACARYPLRGCQLILQLLYGTLKRMVNEWQQKPGTPPNGAAAKSGKKAALLQCGGEEVRMLQKEVELLRQEIREMRQQNRELLEQLMKGGESRALPTQLNPPELSVVSPC